MRYAAYRLIREAIDTVCDAAGPFADDEMSDAVRERVGFTRSATAMPQHEHPRQTLPRDAARD